MSEPPKGPVIKVEKVTPEKGNKPGQKISKPSLTSQHGAILNTDPTPLHEQLQTLHPTLQQTSGQTTKKPTLGQIPNPLDQLSQQHHQAGTSHPITSYPSIYGTHELALYDNDDADGSTSSSPIGALTPNQTQNTADSNSQLPPIYVDLDIDDACIIRLYKLKQQAGTEKLKETASDTSTKLDPTIFKEFADKINNNFQKQIQIERTHKNQDHYTPLQFTNIFAPASELLHKDVKFNQESNTLSISFQDKTDTAKVQQVTTTLDEQNNKILLNASDNGDQSLVVLIEIALKMAKTIYPAKATFIIYPPLDITDLTQQAKLATMANFAGLKTVFQPNPKISDNDQRNQQFVEFKKALQTQFGTDDPSRLQNNHLLTPKKINPDDLMPQTNYKQSHNK